MKTNFTQKVLLMLSLFIVFTMISCGDSNVTTKDKTCSLNSDCEASQICFDKKCSVCPTNSEKVADTCECSDGFEYELATNTCKEIPSCESYTDCDDSSICYDSICRVCPEGSVKSGDTCICSDTETYFYKEVNKCEVLVCAPENGASVSRPLSCQGGLGYCFKDEGGLNGTCKPNTCTADSDCGKDQHCTFSTGQDNLIFLTCQDIGTAKIGEACSKLSNNCESGLSCLEDDENKMTCQEICIPGNDTSISSCSEDRTCIDYANFNANIPSKLIGACLDENLICNFTSSQYSAINDASCNDNNGICVRQDLDVNIGFCLADECNPTASECAEEQKCVFNGQTYKCKDKNTSATGADGASCQNSSTCNTGLTCIKDGDNDDKHCRRLCRPNNLYSYDDCLTIQQCTDLNSMVPEFAENVVGFCQIK